MLKATVDAVRAVLKTDPSMTDEQTCKAITAMQTASDPKQETQRSDERPVMSAGEAARFLGVTIRTVRRLAKEGSIVAISFPGRARAFCYDAESVRALYSCKRSA